MSNLAVYLPTPEQRKIRLRAAVVKEISKMPTASDLTTADRLLYLKERLDRGLINEPLFRAVRDEITYRGHRI